MLQSFIIMGAVSVIWVVFGFSLSFGSDIWHVIGNPADFFMFDHVGVQNVTAAASERAAMLWLGWFGFNGGSSLAADVIEKKSDLTNHSMMRNTELNQSPR